MFDYSGLKIDCSLLRNEAPFRQARMHRKQSLVVKMAERSSSDEIFPPFKIKSGCVLAYYEDAKEKVIINKVN